MYFYLEDEGLEGGGCCLAEEENSSDEGGSVGPPPLSHPELVTKVGWAWQLSLSAVKYTIFGCFVVGLNRLHNSYHGYKPRKRKRSNSGDVS